jgi:hypothetical protein
MPATIGNRQHAIQAYNYVINNERRLPEGFECVGSGSFRTAMLHRDTGVVYKVQHYTSSEPGYNSITEVRHAKTLSRKTFKNVRIPKVSAFKIDGNLVVAMEFIKGVNGRLIRAQAADGRLELYRLGFHDMHSLNIIVDGDTVVPVDMASPRSPRRAKAWSDIRVLDGTEHYKRVWEEKYGEPYPTW